MIIAPGTRLYPGQRREADGVQLYFDASDGVLKILAPGNQEVWRLGPGSPTPRHAEFQIDGNLVNYGDEGAYASTGTFARQPVMEVSRRGLVISGQAEVARWDFPVPPEPPPGQHPDPLVGQWRTFGETAWGDANGPRNAAVLHLLDLIGQGLVYGRDRIRPALTLAARHGFHAIRAGHHFHTDPGGWWDQWPAARWNPADAPVLFREILADGAALGLRWSVGSMGIKGIGDAAETAAFEALRDAIGDVGPEHFMFVVGLNESAFTGDEDDQDPNELERLARIIYSRYPQVLCGLTAVGGTEDRELLRRYTPARMNWFAIHQPRDGNIWDVGRHMFSRMYEGKAVRERVYDEEPGGPPGPRGLVSGIGRPEQWDAHGMQYLACMSTMCRGVWTLMSGPGVVYGTSPLEDVPGLAETPAVIRAMPADVSTYQMLGHSGPSRRGQRIHAVREDAPNVRADYAIAHDGRYVEIIHGPPNEPHNLPQERRTVDDRVILDGPIARVTAGRLA